MGVSRHLSLVSMGLQEPTQWSCNVHSSREAFIPGLPRQERQLDMVLLENISEFLRLHERRIEKVFGLSRFSLLSLKKETSAHS